MVNVFARNILGFLSSLSRGCWFDLTSDGLRCSGGSVACSVGVAGLLVAVPTGWCLRTGSQSLSLKLRHALLLCYKITHHLELLDKFSN